MDPLPRRIGAKSISEPEYLERAWYGGWWATEYRGYPAKMRRPTQVKPDPKRGALGEQPQQQADKTDGGDRGEVPGARRMIHGVLVPVTHRPGRGLALCCVLRTAGARRRVASKMQRPEDPVTEKQCPHEEERQKPLSGRVREQTVKQLRCSRLPRWPL